MPARILHSLVQVDERAIEALLLSPPTVIASRPIRRVIDFQLSKKIISGLWNYRGIEGSTSWSRAASGQKSRGGGAGNSVSRISTVACCTAGFLRWHAYD